MTDRKSIPNAERIRAWTIIACVAIVAFVVAGATWSDEKVADLGHILTTPPAEGSLLALLVVVVAVVMRARHTPPPVALLLVAALGATTLSGCTAADFAKVMDVARPIVKWTCGIATMLCEKGDGDEACAAMAVGCGVANPLVDALAGETSGGEEEGVSLEDAEDAEVAP